MLAASYRANPIFPPYNGLIGRAIEAEKRADKPILQVTSATSGKTIEVTDLKSVPSLWRADKLDIGIRAHPEETKQNRGTLRAVVIQADGIEQDIGIVNAEQVKELDCCDFLKPLSSKSFSSLLPDKYNGDIITAERSNKALSHYLGKHRS